MASVYKKGGADYEIQASSASVANLTDKNGESVFLWAAFFRRLGDKDWIPIFAAGTPEQYAHSTADRARESAERYIDENDV
jgi:hypothetical protein